MAFRPDLPQLEYYFGPTAPLVAFRRAGEEFRALDVLYRPLVDEDGRPERAGPANINSRCEAVVSARGFDQRLTSAPLIVVNHELWIRTGEPHYVARPSHAMRTVTAWSDVWRTPYMRELEGIYFADEREDMLAQLAHWESRGYKVIRGDDLAPIEVTGALAPGSTVFREGLRDLPAPDSVSDDQFAGIAQEVAVRLSLTGAVPRGSRVPLLDYDVALLDISQQRVADDWVAAVLARGIELELFDGIPRR